MARFGLRGWAGGRGGRSTRKPLLVALLAAAWLLIACSAALGQTLDGETLDDPTPQITGISCDIDRGGTFSYRAEGVASGPYPGTFIENGTVAFGPQNNFNPSAAPFPDAQWTRISAEFTIRSEDAQALIVGRKTLVDTTYNFPENEVVCARFPNPTAPDVTSGYAIGGTSNGMEYEARIISPQGQVSVDSGPSRFLVFDFNYVWEPFGPQAGTGFFESFGSPGPPE